MTYYFIGELLVDKIGDDTLEEADTFSKRAGGAPANVAAAVSRLGEEANLVATVGDDSFGDFLERRMQEEGVNLDRIRRSDRKTTLAFVGLDSDAEPEFSFYRGADEDISQDQLDLELNEDDTVHVGSLPFTDPELSEKILELVEETDATVSFDPNLRKELKGEEYVRRLKNMVRHTDLLFADEEEIEELGGSEELLEDVSEILVSKGSRGAELIAEDERIREPARNVEPVDTTGAGDALTGAYLAHRSDGCEKALSKAVDAAAESIKQKGAISSLPDRKSLAN